MLYAVAVEYIFMHLSITVNEKSMTEIDLGKQLTLCPLSWTCPLPVFCPSSSSNIVLFPYATLYPNVHLFTYGFGRVHVGGNMWFLTMNGGISYQNTPIQLLAVSSDI